MKMNKHVLQTTRLTVKRKQYPNLAIFNKQKSNKIELY